jgi:hypothetical protein
VYAMLRWAVTEALTGVGGAANGAAMVRPLRARPRTFVSGLPVDRRRQTEQNR